MKKILSLLMIVMLLSACAPGQAPIATVKPAELQTVEAYYELMDKYPLQAEAVQKIRAFQNNSVTKLFKLEDNEFYSALSLYTALSLVAPGAIDSTAREFEQVLGMTSDELKVFVKNLAPRFNYDSKADGKMHLANSVWVDKKYQIDPDYEKTIREDYLATIQSIDFEDPKAGEQITAWVKEHTFGLLEPEYSDLKDTAMMLANALYMNASWSTEFDSALTKADTFTTIDGQSVKKDFMHQQKDHAYLIEDDLSVINLRLSGGMHMKFIMPKADLKGLMQDPAKLESILKKELQSGEVKLALPKFETDRSLDLVPLLRELGLNEATSEFAKIPNMADADLMITRVKQANKIKLDEKGVEAAAVTTVEMGETSAPIPSEPVEIKLDRPFVYVIESQEGVPLFIGTMIK